MNTKTNHRRRNQPPSTPIIKGNLTDYGIDVKKYGVKYDLDNHIIKVNIDNTDVKYRYDALGSRVIHKQKSVTKTALAKAPTFFEW